MQKLVSKLIFAFYIFNSPGLHATQQGCCFYALGTRLLTLQLNLEKGQNETHNRSQIQRRQFLRCYFLHLSIRKSNSKQKTSPQSYKTQINILPFGIKNCITTATNQ